MKPIWKIATRLWMERDLISSKKENSWNLNTLPPPIYWQIVLLVVENIEAFDLSEKV